MMTRSILNNKHNDIIKNALSIFSMGVSMSIFNKWLIAASTNTANDSGNTTYSNITPESTQHIEDLNFSDKLDRLLALSQSYDSEEAKSRSANNNSKVQIAR